MNKKIVFFESERSQKFVLSESKKDRLQKIATEAIEQCYGNIVPSIEYIESLAELEWQTILCHTEEKDSISLNSLHLKDILKLVLNIYSSGNFFIYIISP